MVLRFCSIEAYHHRADAAQQDSMLYKNKHEANDGDQILVFFSRQSVDVMKEIVSGATSSKHCTWTFTPTFDPKSSERTFREFMAACWSELIEEAVGIPGSFVCPFILGSDSESTLSCHLALHPPRACQPPRAQLLITLYYVVESPQSHRWRPASECSPSDLDPNSRRLLASFAPSRSGEVADIAVCGTFQAVLSHEQD